MTGQDTAVIEEERVGATDNEVYGFLDFFFNIFIRKQLKRHAYTKVTSYAREHVSLMIDSNNLLITPKKDWGSTEVVARHLIPEEHADYTFEWGYHYHIPRLDRDTGFPIDFCFSFPDKYKGEKNLRALEQIIRANIEKSNSDPKAFGFAFRVDRDNSYLTDGINPIRLFPVYFCAKFIYDLPIQ